LFFLEFFSRYMFVLVFDVIVLLLIMLLFPIVSFKPSGSHTSRRVALHGWTNTVLGNECLFNGEN